MSADLTKERRSELIAAFRRQTDFCQARDAAFTASVLAASGDLLEDNYAPFWSLIEGYEGDPHKGALALRIAGALHALVLQERAGALEQLYSKPDTIPDPATLQKAIRPLIENERKTFEAYVASAPQTNEINRAGALLFGFSEIAKQTTQPINLYEVGASAGMLLCWDQFHYDFGAFKWGAGDTTIRTAIKGDLSAKLKSEISVAQRQGCDLNPLDIADPDTLLRMRSFIWPEDIGRRALFDRSAWAVIAINPQLDKMDALSWVRSKLRSRPKDGASVFYHSVFAPYLSNDDLAAFENMIVSAGQSATPDTPLAWLKFEPEVIDGSFEFFLDLQIWPSGESRRLLRAHPHGLWVEPLSGF